MAWCRRLRGRWRRRGRHHRLGTRGEALAERHLRRRRWRVLARNARTPAGEADLVFESPDGAIVLVEVKTRETGENERIDPARVLRREQCRRLQRVLEHLVSANAWHERARRIDLVIVEMRGSGPVIRHFPDAGRLA